MSDNTHVNPTNWIKEYTFKEFSELNPHIKNQNQLIELYNIYLHKVLEEQNQKKINFKQSKVNQLLTELKDLKFVDIVNISQITLYNLLVIQMVLLEEEI